MKIIYQDFTAERKRSYKVGPLWFRPNEYKMSSFFYLSDPTGRAREYVRFFWKFYWRHL